MRSRIAQIAVLSSTCFLAGLPPTYAQHSVAITPAGDQTEDYCFENSGSDREQTSGSETSIAEVTFSRSLRMPVSDQDQIADSIKRITYRTPPDGVIDEALERVRAGWQDKGYFKVLVSGDAKTLTSSPTSQRIALSVHVDEGPQYTLSGITFKNNRAISDFKALRNLFPIKDGDIFSRKNIAMGLENLRKAYGEIGYINFTPVPDTKFDDENKLVYLEIDLDEGKQFYVSSINILGLDGPTRQQVVEDSPLKPGQIYNARLLDIFLQKHISILKVHPDEPGQVKRQLDEKAGTVAITVYARPCPVG